MNASYQVAAKCVQVSDSAVCVCQDTLVKLVSRMMWADVMAQDPLSAGMQEVKT